MWLKKSLLLITILALGAITSFAQESIAVGDSLTIAAEGTAEIVLVLDAVEGDDLIVSTDSADDTYLEVTDADGVVIASDDDSGPRLNAEAAFTVPADGQYTITVTEALGGELSGDVSVSLMDAATATEDAEVDTEDTKEDTSVEAVPAGANIEVGQTVSGEFEGDIVEYTFEGVSGESYRILLESDDFDTYLELYDADEMYLDQDDDGGGDTNSLLIFSPGEDGTYVLNVSAYGEDTGEFTLSITVLEATAVTIDEPLKLKAGAIEGAFTFEGSEGDLFDVYAITEGDDDVYLTVVGPDGYDVDYDDDGGVDYNPYIRALSLPMDGVYRIEITSYSGDLTAPLTLYVETTEPLIISEEPVVYKPAESYQDELLAFDVEEDGVYRLVIEIVGEEDPYIYGTVFQPEDDTYGSSSFSFSSVMRAAMDITADDDGSVRVELDMSGIYNEDTEVSISVTPVTE